MTREQDPYVCTQLPLLGAPNPHASSSNYFTILNYKMIFCLRKREIHALLKEAKIYFAFEWSDFSPTFLRLNSD